MLNPHWTGPPIIIKSPEETERCRVAGRVVIDALRAAGELCRTGITTAELDAAISRVLESHGALGLFRGYRQTNSPPFPAEACISVNDEVVHGVPSERKLQPGDLVSIDVGVRLEGYCADSAVSFLVPVESGSTDEAKSDYLAKARLIRDTRRILDGAIERIRPGRRWSEIARWMETATLDMGYDLITEFVGHGIGTDLHEPPKVPCYWSGFIGQDFVLEPGMILAIEPMLVLQDPEGAEDFLPPVGDQHAMRRALILTAPDGWTIRTVTGAVSCHEEYMVSIGESGPEILTLGTPRVDYLGKAAG